MDLKHRFKAFDVPADFSERNGKVSTTIKRNLFYIRIHIYW